MPVVGKLTYSANGNGAKKNHPAVSTLFLATDEGDNKYNAYIWYYLGKNSKGNSVVWRRLAQFTDEGKLVSPEGKPVDEKLEFYRIDETEYNLIYRKMTGRNIPQEYEASTFRTQYENAHRVLERARNSLRKSSSDAREISESIAAVV